jgi:hypothetical protein
MKIKNHTPSHKVRNSKSLLSSTIEYIKNDLKSEYYKDGEKSSNQSKKILTENEKNKKTKISNLNTKIQEQINQRQSKP